MDVFDAIKNRRSIRNYKTEQIPNSSLQKILDTAIIAPNARNMQQWHFSVVRNRDLLDRLVDVIKRNIAASDNEFLKQRVSEQPNYHTFYRAPTVVMMSAPSESGYAGVDCGAAAENMCLAAESLEIGSIILGSPSLAFIGDDGEALKKEVKIPDGYEHIVSVALGFMKGEKPVTPERDKDVFSYVD